ncbi:hypothetical protein EVAR_12425_1 [Eumeta japonica]|uniref:Uncharacterized protein n=1 Tax=Eumeta variegata TaxID=151549 RepID=A0A4C1U005_EUMVA|nr:hypothetical protein EVAR_12425_1 [Eumeta japonica]
MVAPAAQRSTARKQSVQITTRFEYELVKKCFDSSTRGATGTYQEQNEKIRVLPGLRILAPSESTPCAWASVAPPYLRHRRLTASHHKPTCSGVHIDAVLSTIYYRIVTTIRTNGRARRERLSLRALRERNFDVIKISAFLHAGPVRLDRRLQNDRRPGQTAWCDAIRGTERVVEIKNFISCDQGSNFLV